MFFNRFFHREKNFGREREGLWTTTRLSSAVNSVKISFQVALFYNKGNRKKLFAYCPTLHGFGVWISR